MSEDRNHNGSSAAPTGAGSVTELDHFINFAATLIQKQVKGYLQRKRFLALKQSTESVQKAWRLHDRAAIARELAAVIVQRAWRRYHGRQTFVFYRDLISFKERADPKEVLRFINPREASLVDAAAGVHVRFRLGGACFPPLVFYKIFTHRPVLDIGFFCPRNYAGEASAREADVHAKTPCAHSRGADRRGDSLEQDFEMPASLRHYIRRDGTLGTRELRGWYRRTENNGWRPMSEAALADSEDAGRYVYGSRRTPLFHFDPAVRREDRVRKHKARRREWMVAMYRQQAPDERDPQLFDVSAEGWPGDAELLPDEKLLQWCGGLDFDDYLHDWRSAATTYASEAFVPVNEVDLLDPLPPHAPFSHAADNYTGHRAPLSSPYSGEASILTGVKS